MSKLGDGFLKDSAAFAMRAEGHVETSLDTAAHSVDRDRAIEQAKVEAQLAMYWLERARLELPESEGGY